MMHVAHVGNYKPESPNGVDQAIARYVKHLSMEGFEVEIWHFTSKVNKVRERQVDSVRIFDLPKHQARWRDLIHVPKKTRHFLEQRSREVDVFHLHAPFTAENLWVARLGTPYVVTPHIGYKQVVGGRASLLKRIWTFLWERSYLNRALAVHAICQLEVDDFRNFGIEAPIVSIPQGVDSELLRRDTPKPHEAPAWVYLGRLAVYQKGLDLLVKGYALLYEQRGGELPPLVLAGPDFRGGREQLEQLARSLGVTESIKFIGPVYGDDKWDVLAQARLFVHTSRFDTSPFSVLEALALGRPVLVTPEAGCTEYVEGHGVGWIVAGTPEAIAKGLNTVLETSPQELDAAADRARSLVRNNFSWPSWTRQMAKVYREAIE